jgi:hypothetical protein
MAFRIAAATADSLAPAEDFKRRMEVQHMDTSQTGVQLSVKALTITVDECRVRWQTGAPLAVVDSRRPDDWAASAVQIQHAHRLDPERLPAEFTGPKGRAILVYCH